MRVSRKRETIIRNQLPYGVYYCHDGKEVLFNRRYQPIWAHDFKGAPAYPVQPDEFIPHVKKEWFYKDGNTPWHNRESLERCRNVLIEWGVTPPF